MPARRPAGGAAGGRAAARRAALARPRPAGAASLLIALVADAERSPWPRSCSLTSGGKDKSSTAATSANKPAPAEPAGDELRARSGRFR